MKEKLELALQLRKDKKLEESNKILVKLASEYYENPIVQYQCAWSFDILELEREAIKYYEKSIELGLEGANLQGALLGLGSTYRTLGKYRKSKEVFEKGMKIFPKDKSLETFYAMTLYNLGNASKAMEILLNQIAETSVDENIKAYNKAIKFYADKLDKIW